MSDEPDLRGLADIDDPFAEDASAPVAPQVSRAIAPSPTRTRVQAIRVTAFAAALLYDAAWVVLKETRPDLRDLPWPVIAVGLGIPLAAAALALGAAAQPGARGLGLSAGRIAALATTAPAIFVVATLLTAPPAGRDDQFWRHVLGCMAVTAILAVGPLGLGLSAFRRAFVAAAGWRTAAVGVACGCLAAATMSLACPLSAAWHVILGHGTVMLVAGSVGALVSRALARA
jgi:hypothetical protein